MTSTNSGGKTACSSQSVGKAKPTFAKLLLFSVIGVSLPFFGMVYIHDKRCDPFYQPAFNLSQALADEFANESGKIVAVDDSQTEGIVWKVSRMEALPDNYGLLEDSGIIGILDQGDFSYLKAVFPETGSASSAVTKIGESLTGEITSDDDARRAVFQAANVMERVHAHLKQTSHPLLFRFEAPVVGELREKAYAQLERFKEKVKELKREAKYESRDKPVAFDLNSRSEQCRNLVQLSEETCRASRMTFVLIYAISNGSRRDQSLRQEFLELQKVAEQITRSLADHSSVREEEEARLAIEHYAKSMRRRVTKIEDMDRWPADRRG